MPTHKSARELLNSLYQDGNAVEGFDPVIANGEVDIALAQLAELVRSDMSGKCDTPICTPALEVTHDMAIDAGDPELEGTLFREPTYERCGGCPSCIIDQTLEHIAQKLEQR